MNKMKYECAHIIVLVPSTMTPQEKSNLEVLMKKAFEELGYGRPRDVQPMSGPITQNVREEAELVMDMRSCKNFGLEDLKARISNAVEPPKKVHKHLKVVSA